MSQNYSKYLRLEGLLAQQQPLGDPPEHDEMLFIIIHQTYELWFKQVLHEFGKISRDLLSGDLYGAIATFKRVRMIFKTLVGQLDILETMTPMSFQAFRERLETSSGFQSTQFREFEFALGFKRPEMLRFVAGNPSAEERLLERLRSPSLYDDFYCFLEKRGVKIPEQIRNKPIEAATIPHEAIQEQLIAIYTDQPDVAILLELMVDLDEGIQEWRYRHVKMVERTIGNKKGTGGSSGVDFLKKSLFQPAFPDLWALRRHF